MSVLSKQTADLSQQAHSMSALSQQICISRSVTADQSLLSEDFQYSSIGLSKDGGEALHRDSATLEPQRETVKDSLQQQVWHISSSI